MWTGSWLAYGEIFRNSAIGAARFLHKAMRLHVVRIAVTGKGVTIEIMGQGLTTETTGQGPTTVHGLTTMTTNKEDTFTHVSTSMVYNRLIVEWLTL